MRIKRVLGVLTVVAGLLLVGAPSAAAQAPQPGDVLFSDGFEGWQDANQRVEDSWQTWAIGDCACEGQCACLIPEYKQSNPMNTSPDRVHGGSNAQQYFSFFGAHHAGVWKQFAVTPGTIVEVHAWGTAWSSNDDDPRSFDGGQDVRMRIGVDSEGGTDAASSSVIWGETGNPPNRWQELPAVTVTAGVGGKITVFLGSNPRWPLKHNDIYWDDVYGIYKGRGVPALPPGATLRVQNVPPGVAALQGTPVPGTAPAVDPALAGLAPGTASGATQAPATTGGSAPWLTGVLLLALASAVGLTFRRARVR